MADIDVRAGGVVRTMDEGQQEAELKSGGLDPRKVVGKEEAAESAQYEHDIGLANRELSPVAQGMMGSFSGLTMGFGPAGLVKAMEQFGDKDAPLARHLMAGAQRSDAHDIGQVAGFIGGSVITGGVLDEAAAVAKLGALMPEASGIMGSVIRGAIGSGVKGTVEGSLMGLGSYAEDAALRNKAMSAEAALAHMGEGALVGGGLGAVFGGLGGGLRATLDGGGGAISAALKKPKTVVETLAEADAMAEKAAARQGLIKDLGSVEGGMPGFLGRTETALEREGLQLTSDPRKIAQAADKLHRQAESQRIDIMRQFDREAPGAVPSWTNFTNRVRDEVVGDAIMAPGGDAMARRLSRWLDEVAPDHWLARETEVEAMHLGDPTYKKASVYHEVTGPDSVKKVRMKIGEEEGYTKIKKAKVDIADDKAVKGMYAEVIGPDGKVSKVRGDVLEEGAGAVTKDSAEMVEQVRGKPIYEDVDMITPGKTTRVKAEATVEVPGKNRPVKAYVTEEGAPATFEGWAKGRDVFRDAPAGIPKEAAQRVRQIYQEELNAAMERAEMRNPNLKGKSGQYKAMELEAETMRILKSAKDGRLPIAGKNADIKKFAKTHGPDVSEMMWRMSTAAKTVKAINDVKGKVLDAVKGFMATRNSVVTASYVSKRGSEAHKSGKDDFSRANYERQMALMTQLMSASREEREQYYMKHTGSLALSSAMADVAERAATHIAPHIPASTKHRQATKLRPIAPSVVLRPDEHKILKRWGIIKNPLSALDDLKSGRLSKDSVDTLKNVWPETYNMIVATAEDEIVRMKAEGKSMPVERLTQLSILLDSPLDSTLQKTFIDPVQMALNEPEPKPKPPAPSSGASDGSEHATPLEEMLG